MKVSVNEEQGVAHVQLTRRNLEVLLAKLDEPTSAKTILKEDKVLTERGMRWVARIEAVENEKHYDAENPPGVMLVGGKFI